MRQERIKLETEGMLRLADSILRAAAAQKALTKATLAAQKAAKGALAAFDELNVLELKSSEGGGSGSSGSGSGGSSGSGNAGQIKPPKPEPEEISAWDALQQAIVRLLDTLGLLKPATEALWDGVLAPLGVLFSTLLEGISAGFAVWWEGFSQMVLGGSMLLNGLLTGQWDLAWQGLVVIFDGFKNNISQSFLLLWEQIKAVAGNAVEGIKILWSPLAGWFSQNVLTPLNDNFGWLWEGFKTAADLAFQTTLGIWEPLSAWFSEKVAAPVMGGISKLWEDTVYMFRLGSSTILGALKGYMNKSLEMLEVGVNFFVGLLNGLIEALNSISVDIPDWVPKYGGSSFGISIPLIPRLSIPRLATGAVIPPNAEFAAVLGDQKNGRNLEAPEGLLRDIVREEGGARELVIRFEGSMAQLVRMLKPELDIEDKRRGAQLIVG